MEFVLKSKFALTKINSERKTEFTFLKPLQFKSIQAAESTDTLAILPTGYGKSMIFELLPRLDDTTAVIVSPLNAIIEEQTNKLGERCLRIDNKLIKKLQDNDGNAEIIESHRYMYLIGHPEHILAKEVCSLLRYDTWRGVSHIIIDEAHCVVQWGHAFRPDYQNLSKLRAIFPSAKVVALTATATKDTQQHIITSLCMKNVRVISCSIDRPNVRISVEKRLPSTGQTSSSENSFHTIIVPVIKKLCTEPSEFPKTIVYCKLKWCGEGYETACRETVKLPNFESVLEAVSQYHAPCTEEVKRTIVKDMANPDGKIRLLFATEAYGMGADAPDIRKIMHFGPPTSLETYMQEIGRAGRDGNPSEALLYFNMSDIASNTNVKSEVREFCLLDSCRRKYLCDHFGTEFVSQKILHNCCDICARSCDCDYCFEKALATCSVHTTSPRENVKDPRSICKDMLISYFEAENCALQAHNPELGTCLTPGLVNEILTLYEQLNSVKDVQSVFPFIQAPFVKNIWRIISFLRE